MKGKQIKGEIRLFQKNDGTWGTEMSKYLADDIGLRMVFTSMIIENLSFSTNIPKEKLTEILNDGIDKNPQHYHVHLGDL